MVNHPISQSRIVTPGPWQDIEILVMFPDMLETVVPASVAGEILRAEPALAEAGRSPVLDETSFLDLGDLGSPFCRCRAVAIVASIVGAVVGGAVGTIFGGRRRV